MERIIHLRDYSKDAYERASKDGYGKDQPVTYYQFESAVANVVHKMYKDGVTMEEAVGLIRFDHTEDQAQSEMDSALQRFTSLRQVFPGVEPTFQAADPARELLMAVEPDGWFFRIHGNGMSMSWTSQYKTDWMSEAELPPQLARAMREGKLVRYQAPLYAGTELEVEAKDGQS